MTARSLVEVGFNPDAQFTPAVEEDQLALNRYSELLEISATRQLERAEAQELASLIKELGFSA